VWRFIATMTRSLAIDAARGSRQNLAPRGEDFRWARIVPLDPAVLVAQRDALGETLDFPQRRRRSASAATSPRCRTCRAVVPRTRRIMAAASGALSCRHRR
jgi:hypothetical protein